MISKNIILKRCVGTVMSAVMGVSLLVPIGVSAEQVSDVGIEYTGTVSQSSDYVVMVYRPGKTYSDFEVGENGSQVIVYENQGEADKDGKFKISFNIDGESGMYPVRIYDKESGELLTDEIMFTNISEFKETIPLLNGAAKSESATAQSVADFIEVNRLKLGFEKNDSVEASAIAEIVLADIKNKEYDAEDFSETIKRYNCAVLVALLNDGKCGNMFEDAGLFINEVDGFANFFGKEKKYENNTKIQTAVTKAVSGKKITSSKQLFGMLPTAFALAVIENPDGVANVKNVIKAYPSLFAEKTQNAKEAALNKAIGKKYDTISDFDAAVLKNLSSNSSSGGGSGMGVMTRPAGTSSTQTVVPDDIYVDLGDVIWARNAIVSLSNMGVLKGTGKDTFEPKRTVKREEFVKMLVAAFVDEDAKTNAAGAFKDVDMSQWYAPYINTAVEKGIVNGISAERFGIGENISREDMATMAFRAVMSTYASKENTAEKFGDYGDISDYAKEAVNVMAEQGIINGSDGKFMPKASATRAEAAKIIYEIYRVLQG